MFNKVLIYKDNLINNIKQAKSENPNSKICAMVKANAYGIGLNEVVKVIDEYVDFYGVACFFEAQNLKMLTQKPILICGAIERDCVDERFAYSCGDIEDLEYLLSLNKKIKIHLKINTGMNRYGFKNLKEFKKVLKILSKSKLVIEGIYTHFATRDDFILEQFKIFNQFVEVCKSFGFRPIIHADNSFVCTKHNHNLDMARIGFNLYNNDKDWFLPVCEIYSKIVQVQEVKKGELVGYDYRCVANKKMKIAILPIGYADGLNLKCVGLELLVEGKLCKILNVCMDCFMLDITSLDLKKGDEICILNKFNSIDKYANYLETSPYEIITNFSVIRANKVLV